jgi:hypothetical protein
MRSLIFTHSRGFLAISLLRIQIAVLNVMVRLVLSYIFETKAKVNKGVDECLTGRLGVLC